MIYINRLGKKPYGFYYKGVYIQTRDIVSNIKHLRHFPFGCVKSLV